METKKVNSLSKFSPIYLRYNDEIRWDNAKWSGSYATAVKRIRYLYVNLIVLIICALIWEFAKVSLDMSIVSEWTFRLHHQKILNEIGL